MIEEPPGIGWESHSHADYRCLFSERVRLFVPLVQLAVYAICTLVQLEVNAICTLVYLSHISAQVQRAVKWGVVTTPL